MGLRYYLAKKIVLATDKNAFDRGTLLGELEESQNRIRNDPTAQRIRKEAREDVNKEMRPVLVVGTLFNGLLWAAPAWLLPGLFNPIFCGAAFAASTALTLGAFYKR